jgi:hypothetical protein
MHFERSSFLVVKKQQVDRRHRRISLDLAGATLLVGCEQKHCPNQALSSANWHSKFKSLIKGA